MTLGYLALDSLEMQFVAKKRCERHELPNKETWSVPSPPGLGRRQRGGRGWRTVKAHSHKKGPHTVTRGCTHSDTTQQARARAISTLLYSTRLVSSRPDFTLFYSTPHPTQPNPTQPNPTQPNPTQPNPTQPHTSPPMRTTTMKGDKTTTAAPTTAELQGVPGSWSW